MDTLLHDLRYTLRRLFLPTAADCCAFHQPRALKQLSLVIIPICR
jgi:hypothetical protein